jgi:hypothetical protein
VFRGEKAAIANSWERASAAVVPEASEETVVVVESPVAVTSSGDVPARPAYSPTHQCATPV